MKQKDASQKITGAESRNHRVTHQYDLDAAIFECLICVLGLLLWFAVVNTRRDGLVVEPKRVDGRRERVGKLTECVNKLSDRIKSRVLRAVKVWPELTLRPFRLTDANLAGALSPCSSSWSSSSSSSSSVLSSLLLTNKSCFLLFRMCPARKIASSSNPVILAFGGRIGGQFSV